MLNLYETFYDLRHKHCNKQYIYHSRNMEKNNYATFKNNYATCIF